MNSRETTNAVASLDPLLFRTGPPVLADEVWSTVQASIAGYPFRMAEPAEGSSKRASRFRRVTVACVCLALLIPAGVLGARSLGLFSGEPVPASAIVDQQDWRVLSAIGKGTAIDATGVVASGGVEGVGLKSVVNIGRQSGVTFYVATRLDGLRCYAVGLRLSGPLFDGIVCPRQSFPSAQDPVLDLSPLRRSATGVISILRLEGFAADGVRTVELQNASGPDLSVDVINNHYAASLTSDAAASRLLAKDATGKVLWSECVIMATNC